MLLKVNTSFAKLTLPTLYIQSYTLTKFTEMDVQCSSRYHPAEVSEKVRLLTLRTSIILSIA